MFYQTIASVGILDAYNHKEYAPMDTTQLRSQFKKELVEDILPFWTRYGWDQECGGMITSLGEDGEILDLSFSQVCMINSRG